MLSDARNIQSNPIEISKGSIRSGLSDLKPCMTFYLVRVWILLCLLCIIGISQKCQSWMCIDWLHGLVTHHQSNLKFAEILLNRWRLLFFLPPFTSFIYSQHKVILFLNLSWSFRIYLIYIWRKYIIEIVNRIAVQSLLFVWSNLIALQEETFQAKRLFTHTLVKHTKIDCLRVTKEIVQSWSWMPRHCKGTKLH